MDKNLPANAGDMGFYPWSRKIPHAEEQRSPGATTTETALESSRATTTVAPVVPKMRKFIEHRIEVTMDCGKG